MYKLLNIILLVICIILVSCSEEEVVDVVVDSEGESSSVVSLKREYIEINTREQFSYSLNNHSSLLIKYSKILKYETEILYRKGAKLLFRLKLVDHQPVDVKTFLKLCPLQKNMSMLSTWYSAHPFSKSGKWGSLGGDYEESSCIDAKTAEELNLEARVSLTSANTDSGTDDNLNKSFSYEEGYIF